MCSFVTKPKDMIPYIELLLPEVKKVLVDPIPEVRSVAARALGSLIKGMGEEQFPDLVSWLLDTLKSDNSNVERSGAAQGLSEESNANLDEVVALAKELQEQTKILPLWGTAQLFMHPRYMHGAATSSELAVYAYAAAQVKRAMKMHH